MVGSLDFAAFSRSRSIPACSRFCSRLLAKTPAAGGIGWGCSVSIALLGLGEGALNAPNPKFRSWI